MHRSWATEQRLDRERAIAAPVLAVKSLPVLAAAPRLGRDAIRDGCGDDPAMCTIRQPSAPARQPLDDGQPHAQPAGPSQQLSTTCPHARHCTCERTQNRLPRAWHHGHGSASAAAAIGLCVGCGSSMP
jgi:hypothetical protein